MIIMTTGSRLSGSSAAATTPSLRFPKLITHVQRRCWETRLVCLQILVGELMGFFTPVLQSGELKTECIFPLYLFASAYDLSSEGPKSKLIEVDHHALLCLLWATRISVLISDMASLAPVLYAQTAISTGSNVWRQSVWHRRFLRRLEYKKKYIRHTMNITFRPLRHNIVVLGHLIRSPV